jgi:hypothetical protein
MSKPESYKLLGSSVKLKNGETSARFPVFSERTESYEPKNHPFPFGKFCGIRQASATSQPGSIRPSRVVFGNLVGDLGLGQSAALCHPVYRPHNLIASIDRVLSP